MYERLDKKTKMRMRKALETLRINPSHGSNIKRLTGKLSHLFRYRISGWRILYEVHEDIRTVRVVAVGRRGDIYN